MRKYTTIALLAVATSLGACAGGPVNQGLTSINQPVVSRSDYVFDARAGSQGLSRSEQVRLADWFEALDVGYGDRISIEDPNPYGSGERRQVVAALAARYGLLLADRAPLTAGQIPTDAMRVVVSRMTAEVPNCPNWDRRSNGEFAGSTMSNYGCSTNSNLAAMIANPTDLVRGQSADGSGDPRTTTRAIDTYRSATPTGADNAITRESTGGQ